MMHGQQNVKFHYLQFATSSNNERGHRTEHSSLKSNFADTAELTGHFKKLFIINAVKSAKGCSYGDLKVPQL